METVKNIASQVRSGKRTLDVGAARDLMKAAAEDNAIDPKTELAVMRDLFEPGRGRSTATGRQLLEAFVQHAAPLAGGPNDEVMNLGQRAIGAVVRTTSAAMEPLFDQYEGTRRAGAPNADLEKQRKNVERALYRYLNSTDVYRGVVGVVARGKRDQLENDPLRSVRRRLEAHYTQA